MQLSALITKLELPRTIERSDRLHTFLVGNFVTKISSWRQKNRFLSEKIRSSVYKIPPLPHTVATAADHCFRRLLLLRFEPNTTPILPFCGLPKLSCPPPPRLQPKLGPRLQPKLSLGANFVHAHQRSLNLS